MFNGLLIASFVAACFDGVKNVFTPKETSGYTVENSRSEAHRDPMSGKIIIDDCPQYRKDVANYGVRTAQRWAKEGRYNLTPDEVETQRAYYKSRMKKIYNLL